MIDFYIIDILIGQGYDQSSESDILLLDISNINEYNWTNNFDLSSPSPPSSLPPSVSPGATGGSPTTTTSDNKPPNTATSDNKPSNTTTNDNKPSNSLIIVG